MKKLLAILTALILGPVALFFLFSAGDAHVAMCMLGAVVLSIFLFVNAIKSSKFSQRIISFAGGWILFYTIITATTLLIYEWFSGESELNPFSLSDPVFIYHFLINFVILLIFWLKLARPGAFFLGITFALLLSPVMFITESVLGWASFMESSTTVLLYVVVGFVLLVLYFVYFRKKLTENSRVGENFNKLIVYILWIYVIATVVTPIYLYFL